MKAFKAFRRTFYRSNVVPGWCVSAMIVVASLSGPANVFAQAPPPLAIFANESNLPVQSKALEVPGSQNRITGRLHANSDIYVGGSGNYFRTGVVEHVTGIYPTPNFQGKATLQQSSVIATGSQPYPVNYQLNDFAPGGAEALAAQAVGKYFQAQGDTQLAAFIQNGVLREGLYYIQGKLSLGASGLRGRVTLVATGEIEISGSTDNLEPFTRCLLAFSSKQTSKHDEAALKIGGSSSRLEGVFYAPAGGVEVSGSDHVFPRTALIGRGVKLNGSNLELTGLDLATCNAAAATNQAPVVDGGADQSITLPANTVALAGAASDDGLPAGAPLALAWSLVSGPGAVTFANAAAAHTTATFGEHGVYVLRLTAHDTALTNHDHVIITVNREKHPPVAHSQSVTNLEDTPVDIVLAGADPDGDALSFVVVSAPSFGILSGTPPNVRYTPQPDYFGPDSFSFKTVDGALESAAANVALTVQPVNDPPTAEAQTLATEEDATLTITLTGSDIEGSALSFTITAPPTHGTLTLVEGASTFNQFTYAPDADYHGPDSFAFTVNDGSADSMPGNVNLTVTAVNDAPLVQAGADRVISLPLNNLTLEGSVSDDYDTPFLFILWSKVSGPGTVTFADDAATNSAASFSAPGVYLLELMADDGFLSGFDEVSVMVNAPPSVNAGSNQLITLPAQAVLAGAASDDGLPTNQLTTLWAASGPGTVVFQDPAQTNTTASFSMSGIYTLSLIADDTLATATNTVTVLVNRAPIVDAGSDQVVTNLTVTLNGTVADDDLPTPGVAAQWIKVTGPGTASFTDAASATTTVTFSQTGVYVLRVSADDSMAISSDEVTIAVDGAPVVTASGDAVVNLPAEAAVTATADDDGLPSGATLSYQWRQVSGPGTVTFGDDAALSTTASFSTSGVYVVQFEASDTLLSTASNVTIIVNQPPVVSAGPDQVVAFPQPAILNASASDDGLPAGSLTYAWTQVSGPGAANFTDASSASTSVSFTAPGIYLLLLTASDSFADGSDQVSVRVTSPPVPDAATLADVTGQCSAAITNPPTATDSCAVTVIGTTTDPLTYHAQGTFTVHWTFDGGYGNISTASQTVIVQDTTPPVVPVIPNVTGDAPVTVTPPTTTDNCAGTVTGTTTDPLTYNAPGTFIVHWTFSDGNGNTSAADQTVIVNGAVPVLIPSPVDRTVATTLGAATEFLYTGSNAVQTGVAPGTIEPQRAAVLRGRVLKPDDSALPGVFITVLDHPEYGQTMTRADGMFDLAVNGGGPLVISISGDGYLPVQRQAQIPWQEFTVLPEVIMTALDTQVTTVDLSGGDQVARGNPVTDADGTRQATVLFPAGNSATMLLPDGTEQPLTTLSVRATEYTVGTNGPAAMPAELPPSSGYTYCVELTADEALAAGATTIRFEQPVYSYVENFLGFPVGTPVPVGYYDRERAQWIPSTNGQVIAILSITGALADLDVDGSGNPADAAALGALGITPDERGQLAQLYAPAQSLWRVPLTHFSSVDKNFPIGSPTNAVFPELPERELESEGEQKVDDPDKGCGSIIELQNQILGEALGVVGTAFSLHYSSDRVSGRKSAYTLSIPLTGSTIPASCKRVELEVAVAGRVYKQSFPASTNLATTFQWDGLDAYGRAVQGQQFTSVRIGYVYDAVYQQPAPTAQSFALISGIPFNPPVGGAAREITLWQTFHKLLGQWDARAAGLGAWSLNVHHVYDPQGRVLYKGNGQRQSAQDVQRVITAFAGIGNVGFSGDGGPALGAAFDHPNGITVGPDGSLYISDTFNQRVRKVAPDGIITTIAGDGTYGFGGDGGPASQAQLALPGALAVGPDGSLFIIDAGNDRVRRVGTDGIIQTVAGIGWDEEDHGEGAPATEAWVAVDGWSGIAVAPDGSFYISSYGYSPDYFDYYEFVLRVGTDGIITRVAGSPTATALGDGGPATEAYLSAEGLALGPDGSLYIADGDTRVRKVGPDGIITTVAGDGTYGFGGDGGPATQAQLASPGAVAVASDGTLYIVDFGNWRLRVVTPDGIITTLAGNGVRGELGDGGPASAAQLDWALYSKDVAVAPDGTLYLNIYDRIRRVAPPLPGFSASDLVIASEDGGALYGFDAVGRHLRTVDALTGQVLYQFGYNAAGLLVTVTDLDGDVTTIERDANGIATAIVGPFGARTTLGPPDANGYLTSIANPAGETVQLTYSPDGLLQTLTDPRQHIHLFHYDDLGRLLRDEDPLGGFTALSRTDTELGYEITRTDALNITSRYREQTLPDGSRLRLSIGADGGTNISLTAPDGGTTNWLADGSVTIMREGPDPRFGMQSPIPTTVTTLTPGSLISSMTSSRSVSLADPNDPLSVVNQTSIVSLNGKPFTSVYNFDGVNRTMSTVSPLQRTSASVLDDKGRVLQSAVPQIAPVNYQYDNHGRLLTVSQTADSQTRTVSYTYDQTQNGGASSGRLTAITDALNRTTAFTYDPNLSGRVTRQTFPNGRFIEFQYDASGNLTGVTPPQKPVHLFDFDAVDLLSQYTPPLAPDTGNNFTTYAHNLNRQLTSVTRPDGLQMNYAYEALTGRLDHIDLPFNERISYQYVQAGCGCSGAGRPENVVFQAVDYTSALHYDYDASLVTGVTWSGPVAGSVNATYDNFFRVNSLSLNGANVVSFGYDDDGLLTQAGALTLTRDVQNGRLTGTTLGNVNDSWTYTGFGEAESYTATAGASALYAVNFARDNAGRITNKLEIIGGVTSVYDYAYDPDRGWLTDVSSNGVAMAHYEYDDNGNRTYTLTTGREVSSAYDDQDRLLQSSINNQPATYTYSANGELQTKTVGSAMTAYAYDVRGSLRGVTLPNGTQIAYVIDATGRRIGKTVIGVLVQGWLYQDGLKPIAELDGAGNVVSRFVYAGKANVPEYMIKGGATYRIITDHLGSVSLVVNAANGAIAQRMDYDEFGRVLHDTNPGFQPFGFAGGLYDPLTGLVRFGARDYDGETGRWTSKDPIRFIAGTANLFAYASNDPINYVDPLGLSSADVSKLIALAQNTTDSMTLKGQRTATGDLNNLLSSLQQLGNWLGKLVGFDGKQPYKGCGDQAQHLAETLNGVITDDKWEFYHITQKAWWYTEAFPAVHQYLIAKSSNPNDPQIILDPWANTFEDMGGIRGIEKAISSPSGASTIPKRQ